MDTGKIVVSVLVHKPVALVWENWINPEQIKQWNVPFDDWHCPEVENDLQPGGDFIFRMETRDGREGFDHKGRYDRIIPCQLIEYTLEDGRRSTVEFQHIDENTIVRESFDPEKETPPDLQQAFCRSVLERFKKHVEGLDNIVASVKK